MPYMSFNKIFISYSLRQLNNCIFYIHKSTKNPTILCRIVLLKKPKCEPESDFSNIALTIYGGDLRSEISG